MSIPSWQAVLRFIMCVNMEGSSAEVKNTTISSIVLEKKGGWNGIIGQ